MAGPPNFANIADARVKNAFLHGSPEVVQWLTPGTKLFKWTASIVTSRGVSAWWQFLEARQLGTGANVPGIQELQTYASRLGANDRDYNRVRMAVTYQWNPMTRAVAIELTAGAWGYVGRTSGQRRDENDSQVFFIGGEYQVWVPDLTVNQIRQIAIAPYLTPDASFGARSGD